MTSLSVGVKSTGILVNSLSKLQVSRRFLCRWSLEIMRERGYNGREDCGDGGKINMIGEKWDGLEMRRRESVTV